MYGNAIDCIAHQAETELFARILSLTCRTFDEKCCIFDKDQMNSKVSLIQYRTSTTCTPNKVVHESMLSKHPTSYILIQSKWVSTRVMILLRKVIQEYQTPMFAIHSFIMANSLIMIKELL